MQLLDENVEIKPCGVFVANNALLFQVRTTFFYKSLAENDFFFHGVGNWWGLYVCNFICSNASVLIKLSNAINII